MTAAPTPTPAQFNVPAAVIIGGGAADQLVPQLERLAARRVLLVTDAFMVSAGLAGRFQEAMEAAGIAVITFADVQPDPTDETVRAATRLFAAEQCDAIVALGGGSPIDAAKAVAVLAVNGEPLARFQGYHQVPQGGVPLVVIPTTAGTGSEVTKVAVITDTARDVKMMMLDRHLLPTVALVDYELTLSMPAPLTAHVGVDTLTHGIEAFVSRKATPLTDLLAVECIRLVAAHLERAWREPNDQEAREGMMRAATLGGMAFANASVALVHGMSRPIGAVFHVPHGLSNAVLLPAVTRFSLRGAPGRYATVARAMGLATAADGDDAATGQCHVGPVGRHAAAVDDESASDHDVEHGAQLPFFDGSGPIAAATQAANHCSRVRSPVRRYCQAANMVVPDPTSPTRRNRLAAWVERPYIAQADSRPARSSFEARTHMATGRSNTVRRVEGANLGDTMTTPVTRRSPCTARSAGSAVSCSHITMIGPADGPAVARCSMAAATSTCTPRS